MFKGYLCNVALWMTANPLSCSCRKEVDPTISLPLSVSFSTSHIHTHSVSLSTSHMQTHIEESLAVQAHGDQAPERQIETTVKYKVPPIEKKKHPFYTSQLISSLKPKTNPLHLPPFSLLPCPWVGSRPPIKAPRSLAQRSSQMVGQIIRGEQ